MQAPNPSHEAVYAPYTANEVYFGLMANNTTHFRKVPISGRFLIAC
jgi:hypothetical protein